MAKEWTREAPRSLDAVSALIQFAGILAADTLVEDAFIEGGCPSSPETDALHQVVALSHAAAWLHGQQMHEWTKRLRRTDTEPSPAARGEREIAVNSDDDAELLAAERELAAFRGTRLETKPGASFSEVTAVENARSAELNRLMDKIAHIPPKTAIGAAVKLRVLTDKDLGITDGGAEAEEESLRQVHAFVEGLATAPPARPPAAGRALARSDYDLRAQGDLEDALTNVKRLAETLMHLSTSNHVNYLGVGLLDHYREAHDAFCRVFRLGEYRDADKGGAI